MNIFEKIQNYKNNGLKKKIWNINQNSKYIDKYSK